MLRAVQACAHGSLGSLSTRLPPFWPGLSLHTWGKPLPAGTQGAGVVFPTVHARAAVCACKVIYQILSWWRTQVVSDLSGATAQECPRVRGGLRSRRWNCCARGPVWLKPGWLAPSALCGESRDLGALWKARPGLAAQLGSVESSRMEYGSRSGFRPPWLVPMSPLVKKLWSRTSEMGGIGGNESRSGQS